MSAASPELTAAVARIWRAESAAVVAVAMRIVRDLGRAEELAQDALVAALEQWPRTGLPARPGAWLVTTVRNRALNEVEHRRMADRKRDAIAADATPADPGAAAISDLEARMDDELGDEVLRLVFTACHPVLPREARVALTLRLIGGLTTDAIARAFLVAEPTVAQRIVRAKRSLADARVPYEVPRGEELPPRLASVLEVVYLVFNEGYAATRGALLRADLCAEAIRLGRVLWELVPDEPEVAGLLALMLLQDSRRDARMDADGALVTLEHQDRARWSRPAIDEGRALVQAALSRRRPGPYQLQAAIAAVHADAPTSEATDWWQIVGLYTALHGLHPTPVVLLNRAVAVAMAAGPALGLQLMDDPAVAEPLDGYHLLHAARADLHRRAGHRGAALDAYRRALGLVSNDVERRYLEGRLGEVEAWGAAETAAGR